MNKQDSIDRENKRVPDEEWIDPEQVLLFITSLYPYSATYQEIQLYAGIIKGKLATTGIKAYLYELDLQSLKNTVRDYSKLFRHFSLEHETFYGWASNNIDEFKKRNSPQVIQVLNDSLKEYQNIRNNKTNKPETGNVKKIGTQ